MTAHEETVAVVGTGDMGSAVGGALVRAGYRVVTAGDGRSAPSRKLAADAGRLAARLVREPLAWLIALALTATAFGVRWRRGRAKRRPALARRDEAEAVPAELRGLVAELERRRRPLGHPRPPGRGLLEHATSANTPLGGTGTRIVRLYYGVRFGGAPVAPGELARLQQALRVTSDA